MNDQACFAYGSHDNHPPAYPRFHKVNQYIPFSFEDVDPMEEGKSEDSSKDVRLAPFKLNFAMVKDFFENADGPAIQAFNSLLETVPSERKALFGIGKIDTVANALLRVEQRVAEVGDKIMTHNEALHDGTRKEI